MLAGIVSIAWNRIHGQLRVRQCVVSFLFPLPTASRRNAPCIVSHSPPPTVYGPLTLASTVAYTPPRPCVQLKRRKGGT